MVIFHSYGCLPRPYVDVFMAVLKIRPRSNSHSHTWDMHRGWVLYRVLGADPLTYSWKHVRLDSNLRNVKMGLRLKVRTIDLEAVSASWLHDFSVALIPGETGCTSRWAGTWIITGGSRKKFNWTYQAWTAKITSLKSINKSKQSGLRCLHRMMVVFRNNKTIWDPRNGCLPLSGVRTPRHQVLTRSPGPFCGCHGSLSCPKQHPKLTLKYYNQETN